MATKQQIAADAARYKETRNETRSKVLDTLDPYHARSLSVMQGDKGAFVHSAEVFSTYSREADCGGNPAKGEPHDRHQLRGLVLVQYFREGGAQFFFAEETIWQAAGVDPSTSAGNTWARTEDVLSRLFG